MPTIEQVALGKGIQASAQDLSDWKAMRGSHGTAIKALADVAEVLIVDLQEQRDELLEALQRVVDNAEQAVFEDWLSSNCPSGDSEQVHRQWLASSEYEDFCIDWLYERATISRVIGENKDDV